MLTRQESIAEYDFHNQRIFPDRLTRAGHSQYLPIVEQLLQLYRDGAGLTRRQLHAQAETIFESIPDCPARRIAAFIKLLDDVSDYESDKGGKAAKLRQSVFRAAATKHPLVTQASHIFGAEQWAVKNNIANDLQMKWPEIERKLFADVIEFHPLKSFNGYENGAALLARYNVAQVQAALYRAVRMTIWANSDLKIITRSIKLSRLMHSIRRLENDEYEFIIDGPASAIRTTKRYGIAMAKMIPMLLACRDWRMLAPIEVGNSGYRLQLQLTSNCGLTSSKTIDDDFDSSVEAELMDKWNRNPLEGWILNRESDLLFSNQKVFTPDFVAEHESGRKLFVEIIGYWTPEYLTAKVETLNQFVDYPILLIAQEDKQQPLEALGLSARHQVLWYKSKISLKQFQAMLSPP